MSSFEINKKRKEKDVVQKRNSLAEVMFKVDNTNDTMEVEESSDISIPHNARFWMYLIFEIPSLICGIFVLTHFLLIRTLRQALYNHMIIVLLILNLVVQILDIPWIIHFYRIDQISLQTKTFCMVWVYIDETSAITTTILFSWATIERHILIFHDRWVSTQKRIFFVHYLPIILLSVYCISFSVNVILFPPCENQFDFNQVVCGSPLCFYDDSFVGIWDTLVNHMLPTIVIIVASAALFGRILYQKKRVRQPIRWKKHRKMAIQLLAISVLYLILYIPATLVEFAHLCGASEHIGGNFLLYAEFFSYYIYLLFPFVCAGSLPHLKNKILRFIPFCQQQIHGITPQIFHVPQRTIGRSNVDSTTIH